jgi:hypothetical protein
LEEIEQASLPLHVADGLRALAAATRTRIVIVRNLTPDVERFNGITAREGVLYVDETAERPALWVAAHEWVHQLRADNAALYGELEQEVRRQGHIAGWHNYQNYLYRSVISRDRAVEELTASVVADALTDVAFLERIAQDNRGLFRRVADAFIRFLDALAAKIDARLLPSVYLRDIPAFRDVLFDVLQRYQRPSRATPRGATADVVYSRRAPSDGDSLIPKSLKTKAQQAGAALRRMMGSRERRPRTADDWDRQFRGEPMKDVADPSSGAFKMDWSEWLRWQLVDTATPFLAWAKRTLGYTQTGAEVDNILAYQACGVNRSRFAGFPPPSLFSFVPSGHAR